MSRTHQAQIIFLLRVLSLMDIMRFRCSETTLKRCRFGRWCRFWSLDPVTEVSVCAQYVSGPHRPQCLLSCIHGNVAWKHSSCSAWHEIPGVWWGVLPRQRFPPPTHPDHNVTPSVPLRWNSGRHSDSQKPTAVKKAAEIFFFFLKERDGSQMIWRVTEFEQPQLHNEGYIMES